MHQAQPDTSARQGILDRLTTTKVEVPELPEIDSSKVIEYEFPHQTFADTLALVGGEAHNVAKISDIQPILSGIDVFRESGRIVSLVDGIEGTVDATAVDDPHDFATVDWTIARGAFMVAENGSIWVDGNTLPHRVLLFIAQYLAIVVPKSEIVSNMHQAYARIEPFDNRFGVFVSGPSKTADIEQSLVLGAHGCRKLQVFVVDEM